MALDNFTDWCDDSHLDLNVGKPREMIVDFRRQGHVHVVIQIHGEPVEIVNLCQYLSALFEDTLQWDLNTEVITKKGHQPLRLFWGGPILLASIQLFLSSFMILLLRVF